MENTTFQGRWRGGDWGFYIQRSPVTAEGTWSTPTHTLTDFHFSFGGDSPRNWDFLCSGSAANFRTLVINFETQTPHLRRAQEPLKLQKLHWMVSVNEGYAQPWSPASTADTREKNFGHFRWNLSRLLCILDYFSSSLCFIPFEYACGQKTLLRFTENLFAKITFFTKTPHSTALHTRGRKNVNIFSCDLCCAVISMKLHENDCDRFSPNASGYAGCRNIMIKHTCCVKVRLQGECGVWRETNLQTHLFGSILCVYMAEESPSASFNTARQLRLCLVQNHGAACGST